MKSIHTLFICTCLCFLSFGFAAAQSVVIQGQVTAAKNDKPVAGAEVFIQGTPINATTNAKGQYALPPVKPGTYSLAVFSLGLKGQQQIVEAREGEQPQVNFSLEELEELLEELVISDKKTYTGGITRLKSSGRHGYLRSQKK